MKNEKNGNGRKTFDAFNLIFLLALSVLMVYPIWYVICAALSDSNMLMGHRGVLWLPINCKLTAFDMMFRNPLLVKSTLNTLIILTTGTL